MHVLMTSDTVGGVWTYTRDLVGGLAEQGIRVTLVSLGRLPVPEQVEWMTSLPNFDYRPTDYRLEWMNDSERDIERSSAYLESVIREVRPDLLHLNQYCYGTVSPKLPRIVVAHSDVVSWWMEVHGHEPESSPWVRCYRDTVTSGLGCADVVVAPSQWMLDAIRRYYMNPSFGTVIHNGRDPREFDANGAKQNVVLSVGRVWDRAKQISLLLEHEQPVPVWIAGSEQEPGREGVNLSPTANANVQFKGSQSQAELRTLFAQAGMYAATSRYEPFGLAPLEAAFSRCAVIANDIPAFHEIWGDSVCYFQRNDADDLSRMIECLRSDRSMRDNYAALAHERACQKFSSQQMVSQYAELYQTVTSPEPVA